jgi:hypothetical protein
LYVTNIRFEGVAGITGAPCVIHAHVDKTMQEHMPGAMMDRNSGGSGSVCGILYAEMKILTNQKLTPECLATLLSLSPETKLTSQKEFPVRDLVWEIWYFSEHGSSSCCCPKQEKLCVPFPGSGDFRGVIHSTPKSKIAHVDKPYLIGSADSWNFKSDAVQTHMRSLTTHTVRTASLTTNKGEEVFSHGFGWDDPEWAAPAFNQARAAGAVL